MFPWLNYKPKKELDTLSAVDQILQYPLPSLQEVLNKLQKEIDSRTEERNQLYLGHKRLLWDNEKTLIQSFIDNKLLMIELMGEYGVKPYSQIIMLNVSVEEDTDHNPVLSVAHYRKNRGKAEVIVEKSVMGDRIDFLIPNMHHWRGSTVRELWLVNRKADVNIKINESCLKELLDNKISDLELVILVGNITLETHHETELGQGEKYV